MSESRPCPEMASWICLPVLWLLGLKAALAYLTIEDPSDVIDPRSWAVDNAIIPDYDVPFLEYQPSDSKSTICMVSILEARRHLLDPKGCNLRLLLCWP